MSVSLYLLGLKVVKKKKGRMIEKKDEVIYGRLQIIPYVSDIKIIFQWQTHWGIKFIYMGRFVL